MLPFRVKKSEVRANLCLQDSFSAEEPAPVIVSYEDGSQSLFWEQRAMELPRGTTGASPGPRHCRVAGGLREQRPEREAEVGPKACAVQAKPTDFRLAKHPANLTLLSGRKFGKGSLECQYFQSYSLGLESGATSFKAWVLVFRVHWRLGF